MCELQAAHKVARFSLYFLLLVPGDPYPGASYPGDPYPGVPYPGAPYLGAPLPVGHRPSGAVWSSHPLSLDLFYPSGLFLGCSDPQD